MHTTAHMTTCKTYRESLSGDFAILATTLMFSCGAFIF
jgi:hypothetical protein